jgi:hypothetical protein
MRGTNNSGEAEFVASLFGTTAMLAGGLFLTLWILVLRAPEIRITGLVCLGFGTFVDGYVYFLNRYKHKKDKQ